ncbi:RNA-directed DNA polymerase from mobile element jockey [Trichonephila clavipes]|nr:RNA-directed DNA polymerase from mobile element jockey [Trichonephila clavipes]
MVDIDILMEIWKNRVKKIDFVLKWLSRVGSEVGPTKGSGGGRRVAIMDFGAPLTIGKAYLKIIMSSFLGFCEWNTRNRRRGDRRKKKRTSKRRKKSWKKRTDRLRKRRGESQSFLLGDADQESETRMSKNALRTGRRQAVELQEHTDSHNLIPDFQHGFRSETSTNHQLLRLTNRVMNGFNSGDTTGGAFDRVWHDGLIFKMIKLNFPSYIIHLINSYLSDRTFQVNILATLSRIGTVSAGSPQGSNLSPMLYNIYTHDFPTTPTVDVCLFADDAAIIAQACNPDAIYNST